MESDINNKFDVVNDRFDKQDNQFNSINDNFTKLFKLLSTNKEEVKVEIDALKEKMEDLEVRIDTKVSDILLEQSNMNEGIRSDISDMDNIILKDVVDVSIVSVNSDIVLGAERPATTMTCSDDSVVPHVIHMEGSVSININALTEERCSVEIESEALLLPMDIRMEESRIECLLDSSLTALDIYDECELGDTGDVDVTCPVADVDMLIQELGHDSFVMVDDTYSNTPICAFVNEETLIQDFTQELQSIMDEFSSISGIRVNTSHEDHTVDSVVDLVVSRDEDVGNNTLDMSVSCEEVQKSCAHVELSAVLGVLRRTVDVLEVLFASGVAGDELVLRGVVVAEARRVFDPGGMVWSE